MAPEVPTKLSKKSTKIKFLSLGKNNRSHVGHEKTPSQIHLAFIKKNEMLQYHWTSKNVSIGSEIRENRPWKRMEEGKKNSKPVLWTGFVRVYILQWRNSFLGMFMTLIHLPRHSYYFVFPIRSLKFWFVFLNKQNELRMNNILKLF